MKLNRWMSLLSVFLFSLANGFLCNQITPKNNGGREQAQEIAYNDSLPFYVLESENEGKREDFFHTMVETIGFSSSQIQYLEKDGAEPVLLFPNIYIKTEKEIPYIHEFKGEEQLAHYNFVLDQRITQKEKAHFPSEKYQIALSSDTYDGLKEEIGSNDIHDVLGEKWGIYTITAIYQSDIKDETRKAYLPQLITNKSYSDHDYEKTDVFLSKNVKLMMKKENKEIDSARFAMLQKEDGGKNKYQIRAISEKDDKILWERNYFKNSSFSIILVSVLLYIVSFVLFFVFVKKGENLLLLCLIPISASLIIYSLLYLIYGLIFSLFLYPYFALSLFFLLGSSLLWVLFSLLFKRKKGVNEHEKD